MCSWLIGSDDDLACRKPVQDSHRHDVSDVALAEAMEQARDGSRTRLRKYP
jgi:hypothetical protein